MAATSPWAQTPTSLPLAITTPASSASLKPQRASLKEALEAGVVIANGSDVGVFAHGDQAREIELLVDYGMKPVAALRSATSVAARALRMEDKLGTVKPGHFAD